MERSGAASVFRVLFVCSGNTCRSPIAEAIARAGAQERSLDWLKPESAGTMAVSGSPASAGVTAEAERRGVSVDGHVSRPLTPEMVAEAHFIVGMSVSHLLAVMDLNPDAPLALATHFLDPSDSRHGQDVDDPIGGGSPQYERAWSLLDECVRGMLEQVQKELPEDESE